MSELLGAAPDQLDELARRFTMAADNLDRITGELRTRIYAGVWQGPDYEAFSSDWSGAHSAALAAAATMLRGGAAQLLRQAAQQRDASSAAGGPAPGPNAGQLLASLGPGVVPVDGTDPTTVSQWWSSLSAADRAELVQRHPELIGRLDGVPTVDRDAANRILLGRELDRLRNMRQELEETAQSRPPRRPFIPLQHMPVIDHQYDEADRLLARLDSLEKLEHRLNGFGSSGLPAYLLGFDPDGDGKAIVAIGNPDTADHVATYVPGVGSDLDHIMDKPSAVPAADRLADFMARHDPTARVSAIAWLDYDAPDHVAAGMISTGAREGSAELAQFQAGLRATHLGEPSHNTVIGYSYGSVVLGFTGRDFDLRTDTVIIAGSPGVGVDHARELGVPEEQVWVTRAPGDAIQLTPPWRPGDETLYYGRDPVTPSFGGSRFETSVTASPIDIHGGYTRNSDFLDNAAAIAVGRPDRMEKQ